MLKTSTFLFLFFAMATAYAGVIPYTLYKNTGEIADYQMGHDWGKKKVTPAALGVASQVFKRTAQATAYLPVGGTAFYLGKFSGQHIIATNFHVCPTERDCVGTIATFGLLHKKFKIAKLFVSIPDVDIALLGLEVAPGDEKALQDVAKNFAFKRAISKGIELLTIGFGIAGNAKNELVANQDTDCKVFSRNAEYKLIFDPDQFNPGMYKAWSFAHGCDISHGDSGSALVEKRSGEIIGIVWTGKFPKSEVVKTSESMKRLLDMSDPQVWTELSYGVPAVKIGEYLKQLSTSSRTDEPTKAMLVELLK
jgi:hypothetical protein